MKTELTKIDSQAIKGLAIWMMIIHHAFYSTKTFRGMEVVFPLMAEDVVFSLAQYFKLCVPLFAFITAYGLAIKYSDDNIDKINIQQSTFKRISNLMIPYWFVFILAQLVCNIVGIRTFSEIYGHGSGKLLYFCLDALGIAYYMDTPTLNGTWWYMSVALLIIFLVPLICKCVRSVGFTVFFGCFLLFQNMGISKLILVAILAVTIYECNLFGKIGKFIYKSRIRSVVLGIVLIGIICICWKLYEEPGYGYLIYCVATLAIVLLQQQFISRIKFVTSFFAFWGKHSMNIFLTHTFIFAYFLHDFVYSLRYGILIIIMIMMLSLILSIIINLLKKLMKIELLIDMLNKKIEKRIS